MSDLENLTMDRLLKRIYALHKQSLNEANQAKTKSTKLKESIQRSDEKVKDLEAENSHLKIENRRLSALEETKQTSNGGCCEVIRQSLQMVISSYKELLENKDQRIKELEEQLVKYKRRFTAGDSLNWTITEDSVSTRTVRPENSPDSTSRFTPVEKTQTSFKHGSPSPTPSSSALATNILGKGEVTSPDESNGKKRLQRRAKRSRYSEEISPEHKRPKLKSDNLPQDREAEKQSRNVIVHDTCYSEKDREHSPKDRFGNNHKKPGILEETVLIVPETLAVDFDHSDDELDDEDIRLSQPYCGKQLSRINEMGESAIDADDNDDDGNDKSVHQANADGEKIRQEGAVDKWITSKSNKVPTDSQKKGNQSNKEIKSDKDNNKKSIKQVPADCKRLEKAPAESERLSSRLDDNLSDAAGAWINPTDKDRANITNKDWADKDRADVTNKDWANKDRVDITNKDKSGNTNKDSADITDKDNKANKADRGDNSDRSRLRSVLSSPESNGHNSGNDSLYEAISDIGANIIDDIDEEEIGSQNRVRVSQSKVKVTEGVTGSSSGTHPLGGRCRNMDEVNELFETPGNKSYLKVRKLDTDVAESISNHKAKDMDKQVVENRKSLFKKSSKVTSLSQEDVILRRSPRKKKDVIGNKLGESADSSIRVKESPESSRGREPDNLSSRRRLEKQRTSSSGESVDHDVTIAPDNVSLTDNQSMDFYHVVPVKNGQPLKNKQFDVKIKKNKNGANKYGAKNICNDRATSDVRLNRNSPSVVGNNNPGSRVPEVITISSPSVGSVSDPESPLLLKDNKKGTSKDNKPRDTNATDKHNNMTDPSKVTRSRSNAGTNQTNNKRATSSTCNLLEDDVDDDDFLMDSPKSKSLRQTTLTQRFFSPEPKHSRNTKNNENTRKSRKGLQMDKDMKMTEDDVTFKRPENPANRNLHRERNRHQEQREHHQPLHDISSRHLNGTSGSLNGSLDPAAELSMLCREPDVDENQPIKSLPSLDTDFCKEDLLSGSESLPKTSTLVADDCEDIPSSYRFMSKKKTKEPANKENLHVSLDDSFDRPPKKAVNTVANIEVVRKKDERQKLQGYGCKQCEEYYKSAGRNDDEIQQHMNKCSRHRAQFLPPDTPPHFWSVGFIDTQECVDRGYMKVDDNPEKGKDDGPPRRRRRRLNKVFKSKTEGTMDTNSDDDLVYE